MKGKQNLNYRIGQIITNMVVDTKSNLSFSLLWNAAGPTCMYVCNWAVSLSDALVILNVHCRRILFTCHLYIFDSLQAFHLGLLWQVKDKQLTIHKTWLYTMQWSCDYMGCLQAILCNIILLVCAIYVCTYVYMPVVCTKHILWSGGVQYELHDGL